MLKDFLVELGLVIQYLIVSFVVGLGLGNYAIDVLGIVSSIQASFVGFLGVFGGFLVVGVLEIFIICCSAYYDEARKHWSV